MAELRHREFVDASVMIGAKNSRIIRTHIFPHVLPTALVYATLLIPVNVLLEAGITFLGVGIHLPTPSWGNLLSTCGARVLNPMAPTTRVAQPVWLTLLPSLMIFITVFTFNQLGEGLREAFDTEARQLMVQFVTYRLATAACLLFALTRRHVRHLRDDPGRAGGLPRRHPARDAAADRRRASCARLRPFDLVPLRRVPARTSPQATSASRGRRWGSVTTARSTAPPVGHMVLRGGRCHGLGHLRRRCAARAAGRPARARSRRAAALVPRPHRRRRSRSIGISTHPLVIGLVLRLLFGGAGGCFQTGYCNLTGPPPQPDFRLANASSPHALRWAR